MPHAWRKYIQVARDKPHWRTTRGATPSRERRRRGSAMTHVSAEKKRATLRSEVAELSRHCRAPVRREKSRAADDDYIVCVFKFC